MLKTGRSDKRLCTFVMNNNLKLITEKNVPFIKYSTFSQTDCKSFSVKN